jgi:hypothetical protein
MILRWHYHNIHSFIFITKMLWWMASKFIDCLVVFIFCITQWYLYNEISKYLNNTYSIILLLGVPIMSDNGHWWTQLMVIPLLATSSQWPFTYHILEIWNLKKKIQRVHLKNLKDLKVKSASPNTWRPYRPCGQLL